MNNCDDNLKGVNNNSNNIDEDFFQTDKTANQTVSQRDDLLNKM